jgi:hypothetical protein
MMGCVTHPLFVRTEQTEIELTLGNTFLSTGNTEGY